VPGVFLDLLQAQADPLGLGVELEDRDADLVADVEDLARVAHVTPAHVGDVQQTVDAAQVDEGAVVGQVLDHAGQDRTLLELLEGLLLELLALLLEQHAAAEHDVAALLVELDDLELEFLRDVLVEVANRADVDLAARQERLDADVDAQPALDPADDGALDDLVALTGRADLVPDAHLVGLLLGEDDHARVVLARLEENVDRIAFLDGHLALGVGELGDRDLPLGLVADVDDREVLGELDDCSLDDFAFLQDAFAAALFERLLEHRGEILDHLVRHLLDIDILHAKGTFQTAAEPLARPLAKESAATGIDDGAPTRPSE